MGDYDSPEHTGTRVSHTRHGHRSCTEWTSAVQLVQCGLSYRISPLTNQILQQPLNHRGLLTQRSLKINRATTTRRTKKRDIPQRATTTSLIRPNHKPQTGEPLELRVITNRPSHTPKRTRPTQILNQTILDIQRAFFENLISFRG